MQSPIAAERHLDALEAAFVAEMLPLKTLALAASSATGVTALEPAVSSWLADWADYHARNGHTPLIKAAIAVALDRLSVQRIAAALWTFHRAAHISAHNLGATAEPQSATARRSIHLPAKGPRGVKQTITVDGQPLEVPACVANFLRDLAHDGTARARPETVRKMAALLPWATVTRDPSAKVIDHKRLYVAGEDLREALK